MLKNLKNSCYSVVVTCFVSTIACADGLSCKNNLSGIDCIEEACKKFEDLTIKNKPDYLKNQTKWYDFIKDTCTNLEDLVKVRQMATENKDFYTISIPKSSESNERYYITVALNPAKLPQPNYNSPFYFVFANSELSTAEEIQNNTITYNDECSESFQSNPDDEDHLNFKLQNNNLKNYSDNQMYDTMEYFMNSRGMLSGNYDAPGIDSGLYGCYSDTINKKLTDNKWKLADYCTDSSFTNAGNTSTMFQSYTNIPITYTKQKDAEDNFKKIYTALDGTQCEGFWLHLVDSKGNIIESIEVGSIEVNNGQN